MRICFLALRRFTTLYVFYTLLDLHIHCFFAYWSFGSWATGKSSEEATPSGVQQLPSSAVPNASGSSETQKSSAEATPSGVLQSLSTSAPGSPVAPKSSAEATPSGVQTTFPAAAAAKKTGGPRPGARRGRKPRRHLCPHCLKWGGHRPEDCFARPRAAAAPAAASVVNNFTVMPGAVVQAGPGGSTSGRRRAVKGKKKEEKKN
ncbi:uncharacterized protein FTJAE_8209 [Fusarium tjaetaba]|uniref:Uncharacterized protein n=1 Tax=Fusarium tjaetaba TaxID=1567544 RepID=A0A8H5RBZ7_9HYPO|nr:uncharacterized protein FTJAE_8209 [Fusarium tjaetaba]KAF5630447.1 hypothetical protein FTJAE_8209 [Fusarium tjaetaba]